jgi:hypothetical protein
MASAIGSERESAAAPARTSTSKISSVAYAVDESASDEKTARAYLLGSFSSYRRSVRSGSPTRKRFIEEYDMISPPFHRTVDSFLLSPFTTLIYDPFGRNETAPCFSPKKRGQCVAKPRSLCGALTGYLEVI